MMKLSTRVRFGLGGFEVKSDFKKHGFLNCIKISREIIISGNNDLSAKTKPHDPRQPKLLLGIKEPEAKI